MDWDKREQLYFAMVNAESKGLDGWAKARYIIGAMKKLYGGQWVAAFWSEGDGRADAQFDAIPGYFADFRYRGQHWYVGKVVGTFVFV